MCQNMGRIYHVIGASSCWGAQIRACEKGPRDLIEGRVFERLQQMGVKIKDIEMLFPNERASEVKHPLASSLPLIHEFNVRLAKRVREIRQKGQMPVVIGGDHTNAVGTWNGMEKPFGLLWIDAHMDAHTMETTPSGAFHGMPVAALLGHGVRELSQLLKKEPVLTPERLALIGTRSFEEGEADLLKKLGVKIYFIEEVQKRGLKEIIPEAIEHVTKGSLSLGISLDLDAFAIDEAPGVGSPESGGIHAKEMLPLFSIIGSDPRLLAFEIVEFNPELDVNHMTRELVFQILERVMQ